MLVSYQGFVLYLYGFSWRIYHRKHITMSTEYGRHNSATGSSRRGQQPQVLDQAGSSQSFYPPHYDHPGRIQDHVTRHPVPLPRGDGFGHHGLGLPSERVTERDSEEFDFGG